MKSTVLVLAAAAVFTAFPILAASVPASAEDAPKGVLVVRSGDPTQAANYDKDDQDANGKYTDVSVQCNPKIAYSSDAAARAAGAAKLTAGQTRFGTFGTANSTAFINAGGKVALAPQKGNPQHCSISGVKLGILTGNFHL